MGHAGLLFLFLLLLTFSSCTKDRQDDLDQALIDDYLANNGLTAQSTSSGLHYIILSEGNSERPDLSSTVIISYTGTLLNGSEFDSSPYSTFNLNSLIEGWKEGIPYIGKGGQIILIVPSKLGYGEESLPDIPANSVLVFHIQLFDFY
jgi:FKBP-type peptidyl-prolyl cis-trans isomerase FkpA